MAGEANIGMEKFFKQSKKNAKKSLMIGKFEKDVNRRINLASLADVLEAYRENGYEVLLGNPDCLSTRLERKRRTVNASFAVSLSDILVFQWIAGMAPWHHALVIGNSFGFSTFVIAALLEGCEVDAIDAEIEGSENGLGSEITRKIIASHYGGVRLTKGYSPQDLDKACRFENYDFIFIDGMHTNKQLISDYKGIQKRCAKDCVVYCHDVGMAKMQTGWQKIIEELMYPNDEAFELHFTSFGSTLVVSGFPKLKNFLRKSCRSLEECNYYLGSRHMGFRSSLRIFFRTIRYSTKLGRFLPQR